MIRRHLPFCAFFFRFWTCFGFRASGFGLQISPAAGHDYETPLYWWPFTTSHTASWIAAAVRVETTRS